MLKSPNEGDICILLSLSSLDPPLRCFLLAHLRLVPLPTFLARPFTAQAAPPKQIAGD
jgi:hypothetical protein